MSTTLRVMSRKSSSLETRSPRDGHRWARSVWRATYSYLPIQHFLANRPYPLDPHLQGHLQGRIRLDGVRRQRGEAADLLAHRQTSHPNLLPHPGTTVTCLHPLQGRSSPSLRSGEVDPVADEVDGVEGEVGAEGSSGIDWLRRGHLVVLLGGCYAK